MAPERWATGMAKPHRRQRVWDPNKFLVAQKRHAGYCASCISRRLASLAPLRRAYGFSHGFPLSSYERERRLVAQQLPLLQEQLGIEPECSWLPEWELRG